MVLVLSYYHSQCSRYMNLKCAQDFWNTYVNATFLDKIKALRPKFNFFQNQQPNPIIPYNSLVDALKTTHSKS